MLAKWFAKDESKPTEAEGRKGEKAPAVLSLDPEDASHLSDDNSRLSREAKLEKKLRESIKEGPPNPNNMVTYDSVFRNSQRVLMEGNQDPADGFQVNMSRNAQNTMISSKWQLGNPQTSHWEVSLQMNGFSDVTAVSYNTMNRWSLMYQRVFRSGAMGVAQFLAQPQGGMNMGTFFGMMQYPWVSGGATQVQYVKQQAISMSHMQRVLRGLHIGSSLNFDPNTHSTTMSYGFSCTNPSKTTTLAGELKPDSGEWKLAFTRQDWAADHEICAQLELSEKRNGKISLLSIGLRKQLIGGGLVNCVLTGFSKLRAVVELPFGGERPGFNQVRVAYNVQYDLHTGGLKQGMSFTV